MDLGIGIKVDPADSVAKADSVTTALHKTEDAGIAAGQAMLGLAGNFKSLAAAIQQHQAALERTNAVHRQLTSTSTAAGNAFGKMAEAIRKEQEILERIHGPARRYAEDLQALDSLLSRQAITTAQYAEQVKQLNHAIDGVPKAPVVAAAPTPTASGLGAALGKGATAIGIGYGAKELAELADGYTNIQNRLNLMTGDQEKANALFEKLRTIAKDSRSDLAATVDAYAGMSRATKQLGLTQDQTLRATKTLNELVTTSGRSASESAAGLMQFSQALSSGRLQGDELRSVFENMPTLVEALEKSLGVTQAQLRKMGEAGTITSQVMVDALLKASSTADASLGKSIPTIGQSITAFKNDVMVMVGELNNATGIGKIFGDTLKTAASILGGLLAPVNALGNALNDVGISGSTATAAIAGMVLGGPAGAIAGVTIALAAQAGAFDDVTTAVRRNQEIEDAYTAAQNRITLSLGLGSEALNKAYAAQVDLNLAMTLGTDVAEMFSRAFTGANNAVTQFSGSYTAKRLASSADATRDYISKRIDDVTEAKRLLDGLKGAKDYLPEDQYQQEYKRLTDIINGVIPSLHKEKQAHVDILSVIRERIAAEESLYKMRGIDSIRNAQRGANDNAAGDDALLAALGKRGDAAQAEREKQVLDVLNMIQTPLEKYNERLTELNDLYATGALSADQFARAKAKIWQDSLGSDWAKAEKERTDELTKSWQARMKALEENNQHFAESFKPIGEAIRDAFMTGEVSAKSLDQTLRQVAFSMFRLMAAQAATALGGTGAGAAVSGILGGFATGGSFRVPNDSGRWVLPRAAYGADWTVGGTGSTDSKIAMFRVTPGERVRVDTPAQQASERASSRAEPAERPLINFIQSNSPSEVTAAFGTRAGATVIHEQNRRWRRSG